MTYIFKQKNYRPDAIISIYSVYIIESVNLDDGDSAIAGSPFLFLILVFGLKSACNKIQADFFLFFC